MRAYIVMKQRFPGPRALSRPYWEPERIFLKRSNAVLYIGQFKDSPQTAKREIVSRKVEDWE